MTVLAPTRWEADLAAGRTLRGDAVPVIYADHAVDRWVERMGRGQERETAERQLWHIAGSSSVSTTPPDWYDQPVDPDRRNVNFAFMALGDDMFLPMVRARLRRDPEGACYLVATTLIARGNMSDGDRKGKQAKGRRERRTKADIAEWNKKRSGTRRKKQIVAEWYQDWEVEE